MDIKPRYDENRVGATIFEPLKATQEDWLTAKPAVYGGGSSTKKIWRIIGMDSRILAGKLLAHENYSELIWKDRTNFVFKVKLNFPPNSKRELIIVGVETSVYVVYQKRTSNVIQENVKKWLMKNLAGLKPLPCKFEFGSHNKLWGIVIDKYEVVHLTYEKPGYGDVSRSVYNEWEWTE